MLAATSVLLGNMPTAKGMISKITEGEPTIPGLGVIWAGERNN